MDDKVIQPLTKAKIKQAGSANLKGITFNKLYRRLDNDELRTANPSRTH